MTMQYLDGGFSDPPRQAAYAFRGAIQALSRPGRIETLAGATPPAPCSPAAGALILTLCDGTTPVHLAPSHDTEALRSWAALQPLDRFAIGTPEYPDRSATLIVEMDTLSASGARLTGPGIETEASLSLPETAAFQRNRAQFPLGFDCFFTCAERVAGLPRSTRVMGG